MLITSRKTIDKYLVHGKDSTIYREARNECDITINCIKCFKDFGKIIYLYIHICIIYILIFEVEL